MRCYLGTVQRQAKPNTVLYRDACISGKTNAKARKLLLQRSEECLPLGSKVSMNAEEHRVLAMCLFLIWKLFMWTLALLLFFECPYVSYTLIYALCVTIQKLN